MTSSAAPTTPPSDNHLVLGPKSFLGLETSTTRKWRKTLKSGQPALHFLFDIPPLPAPTPTGSRLPGIATRYDAFAVWQTYHYRIAIGRWLFDYRNERYFLAFAYPMTTSNFFNGRFGIIKVPPSSVKLSAFATNTLPSPVTSMSDVRAPHFWHPIIQLLRLKAVLTMPVQDPVYLPHRISNAPLFVEAMGTTWALLVGVDDGLLITDVAGELVNSREMTVEVAELSNLLKEPDEVNEGSEVDEDGNWV